MNPYRRSDGTAVSGHLRRVREHLDDRTGAALRGMSHVALTQLGSLEEGADKDALAFEIWLKNADLRGAQLRAANLKMSRWKSCDLSEADLHLAVFPEFARLRGCAFDRADLVGAEMGHTKMRDSSFRGADLRGLRANFTNFRGSDFTGAKLDRASLMGADLRGCTWQGASMRDVILNNGAEFHPDNDLFRVARYERYTFADAAERLGVDDDTLRVLIWADDIEVRDNKTADVVTGEFDPDRHHVPVWAIQNAAAPDQTTR